MLVLCPIRRRGREPARTTLPHLPLRAEIARRHRRLRNREIGRNVIIRNVLDAGYKGRLFAVNPKHKKVYDLTSYPSVEDIPQRLDLVVVATAEPTVPGIIEACGRAGARYVVVISAGFAESGPKGAALERSVLEI